MNPDGEQAAFACTTYIQAGPERVWQGLTDPALMKRYWRHQKAGPKTFVSDWKEGSAHEDAGLVVSGPGQVILESDPPRRLGYTWHTITPEWAAAVGMAEATAAVWRAEARSTVAFDSRTPATASSSSPSPATASRRAAPCCRPSPRGGPPSWPASRPCLRRGRPCAPDDRPRQARTRSAGAARRSLVTPVQVIVATFSSGAQMARVVMQGVVSVDGYIAYPDDSAGPLFDWYGNGDTEVSARVSGWTFHVSQASAEYVRPLWEAIKVTVIGRQLFDTTNGRDGDPAAGDELVVVTRRPLPQAWLAGHPGAPFRTAGSVQAGIALAKELAGDGLVCVTAGDLGGQAFPAGPADEIAMDVAPVVLGEGVRFFAATPAPSSSRIPARWSGATACCTCTTLRR